MVTRYPNLIVIYELMQNYLDHRFEKLSDEPTTAIVNAIDSTKDYLTSFIWSSQETNRPATVMQKLKKLKKDCGDAHAEPAAAMKAARYAKLIVDFGNLAYAMQKLASYPSTCCEALHAIRSYLLMCAEHFPELKKQIAEMTERLTHQLKAKDDAITLLKNSNATPEAIKVDEESRDQIRRELVYLGETNIVINLKREEREALFPRLTYPDPKTIAYYAESKQQEQDWKKDLANVLHRIYLKKYINTYYNTVRHVELNVDKWIDDVVSGFCRDFGFDKNYVVKCYEANVVLKSQNGATDEASDDNHATNGGANQNGNHGSQQGSPIITGQSQPKVITISSSAGNGHVTHVSATPHGSPIIAGQSQPPVVTTSSNGHASPPSSSPQGSPVITIDSQPSILPMSLDGNDGEMTNGKQAVDVTAPTTDNPIKSVTNDTTFESSASPSPTPDPLSPPTQGAGSPLGSLTLFNNGNTESKTTNGTENNEKGPAVTKSNRQLKREEIERKLKEAEEAKKNTATSSSSSKHK